MQTELKQLKAALNSAENLPDGVTPCNYLIIQEQWKYAGQVAVFSRGSPFD